MDCGETKHKLLRDKKTLGDIVVYKNKTKETKTKKQSKTKKQFHYLFQSQIHYLIQIPTSKKDILSKKDGS